MAILEPISYLLEACPMWNNMRGERVYIYAGLQRIEPEDEARLAAEIGLDVDALPRGVIVGTVEGGKVTATRRWKGEGGKVTATKVER